MHHGQRERPESAAVSYMVELKGGSSPPLRYCVRLFLREVLCTSRKMLCVKAKLVLIYISSSSRCRKVPMETLKHPFAARATRPRLFRRRLSKPFDDVSVFFQLKPVFPFDVFFPSLRSQYVFELPNVDTVNSYAPLSPLPAMAKHTLRRGSHVERL